MMMRWQVKLTLAIVVIAGFLTVPFAANAEEPLSGQRLTPELLVTPKPELLSGRPWLVLTGQDPALYVDPRIGGGGVWEPPEVKLQAVGGGAAALIPYRDPAAKFSRTILLSRDVGRLPYQCWPNLAVHPKDPDHIVAVLVDYNFPGISSYVSIDAGATWEGPHQPRIPRGELTGVGDPAVVFDRKGNSYACQMSVRIDEFRLGNLVGSALVASIPVSYSTDGGVTWEETVLAAWGGVEARAFLPAAGERLAGEVWVSFKDKPWISVGPNTEKPDQDTIYVTYTNFIDRWELRWMDEIPVLTIVEEQSVIEVVCSEDGGLTWSRPVQVSPRVYMRGEEELLQRVVQGSQPMVAPDGTLYVAWFDSTTDGTWSGVGEIWVATSKDQGRTFDQPRLVDKFLEVGFWPRSASFRLWGTGFPQMAIGTEGEVYIAYVGHPSDNPEDGGDVFVVCSLDGGRTWQRRVRVNDDGSGRPQFFPSITVDPVGALHMIWGDTRNDPAELLYHIYYSCSEDQGETWELNSRVSDFPSNPNFAFPRGQYIGDCFAIKATKEDVYIAWADSRLGELGGLNQKIGFARKRLMPAASIYISPPSGPAGRDITINGHNFQPESEIFVEVGGVLTATGRTTEDGIFSIMIFAPISGEGARSVVVKDISGNVATASFYTEFGFDTLKQSVSNLEGRLVEVDEPGTTPEAKPESAAEFPWWLVIVLAAALAVTLSALAAIWYRASARRTQ